MDFLNWVPDFNCKTLVVFLTGAVSAAIGAFLGLRSAMNKHFDR